MTDNQASGTPKTTMNSKKKKRLTPRQQYSALYDQILKDGWHTNNLLEWINNPNRGWSETSFTSGSARNVARAIERAIALEHATFPTQKHLVLRPTEQCPHCGYVQVVADALSRDGER